MVRVNYVLTIIIACSVGLNIDLIVEFVCAKHTISIHLGYYGGYYDRTKLHQCGVNMLIILIGKLVVILLLILLGILVIAN